MPLASPLNSPLFQRAVADYVWLLGRGYPEKRSRVFVGDRYGLSRPQRSALLRGVFSQEVNTRRSARRLSSAAAHTLLAVDGTNVLSTICNYLYGRTLFIATDGFLRDDGENYTAGADSSTLRRAADLLAELLAEELPSRIRLYLDISSAPSLAPLAELEATVRARFAGYPGFALYPSSRVDRDLISLREGALAGSDSGIIDRSPLPVFDAAQETLNKAFSPHFPDLRLLLP